jgi:hypothetical protein
MSQGLECISVSSIDSSTFVLEIGDGKKSVAVPYSEWPGLFTDATYS